jgi:hypothetical protein
LIEVVENTDDGISVRTSRAEQRGPAPVLAKLFAFALHAVGDQVGLASGAGAPDIKRLPGRIREILLLTLLLTRSIYTLVDRCAQVRILLININNNYVSIFVWQATPPS